MCLYSKSKEPKTAEEDIVVYKCLRSVKERYSSSKYRNLNSIFMDEPVTHGENHVGKVLTGKNWREPKIDDGMYKIGPGYIHAYTYIEDAKNTIRDHFIGMEWYHPVIVEAVIPKGTKYYEGRDGYGTMSLAAEKMVLGKHIECYVDYKFRECDSYYASLEKEKQARETQPFD